MQNDNTRADKRSAWAEISLKNLAHNLNVIKSYINSSQTKIMTVVKADAYGHGAIEISKQAIESGAHGMGVSLVEEGVKLRRANISAPVYVLGEPPPAAIEDAVKYDLVLSINSYRTAKIISEKCSYLGKNAVVHINVDTGMNRVGINFKDAVTEIIKINSMTGLKVEGAFTHFSCAHLEDSSYTKAQWNRFRKIIKELKNSKVDIKIFHCANSAAFLRHRETHLDMVRTGISIYGLNPFGGDSCRWLSSETTSILSSFEPVLSLKTKISFVKKIPAGQCISYGCTFKTKRESIIATLPVGYADGYSRLLSNKSRVLVGGQFAPVVGNITMDQIMIDVTDIVGEKCISTENEVVLIGKSKGKKITVDFIADLMGTINYEVTCMLKNRIPKIYIK